MYFSLSCILDLISILLVMFPDTQFFKCSDVISRSAKPTCKSLFFSYTKNLEKTYGLTCPVYPENYSMSNKICSEGVFGSYLALLPILCQLMDDSE
jgi:hypothetical protein